MTISCFWCNKEIDVAETKKTKVKHYLRCQGWTIGKYYTCPDCAKVRKLEREKILDERIGW